MTPMPINPILVLRVTDRGFVIDNRNNIGNDLRIVVVKDEATFIDESAGIPYTGVIE